MNNSDWCAPGQGEIVATLIAWIGNPEPTWPTWDLRDEWWTTPTALRIVHHGPPQEYDRERVKEALARVGVVLR